MLGLSGRSIIRTFDSRAETAYRLKRLSPVKDRRVVSPVGKQADLKPCGSCPPSDSIRKAEIARAINLTPSPGRCRSVPATAPIGFAHKSRPEPLRPDPKRRREKSKAAVSVVKNTG